MAIEIIVEAKLDKENEKESLIMVVEIKQTLMDLLLNRQLLLMTPF